MLSRIQATAFAVPFVFMLSSCEPVKDSAAAAERALTVTALPQKQLQAWQVELLELAFTGVSKFPLDPHIKDRARTQQKVIEVALRLEQPQRALRMIRQLPNWRKGKMLGDWVAYAAERGVAVTTLSRFLEEAQGLADRMAANANSQAWRRDRILVAIARARATLGQKAVHQRTAVVDSESGKSISKQPELVDAAAFARQMAALDAVFATGSFDRVKNAMRTCVELFDRFYDDEERRDALEKRVQTAHEKLPVYFRIEQLLDLVDVTLKHENDTHARRLIGGVAHRVDKYRWEPEVQVQLVAKVAGRRHRAGDTVQARLDVVRAAKVFDRKKDLIVTIYRAGALRSIAEAWHVIGDRDEALAFYRRATEAGMENPNSRPRAEDFADTCCSLALHECEPDAALLTRLRTICAGLSDPW